MHGDKYRILVRNNTGDRKSVSCPGQRKQMDNFFHFFLYCVSRLRLLVIKAIDIWPVPIPHLSAGVWNIPLHKSEVIGPKGGKPCDGSSDPEDRNTLVVFLRFFHFARRFWNHTYRHANRESLYRRSGEKSAILKILRKDITSYIYILLRSFINNVYK